MQKSFSIFLLSIICSVVFAQEQTMKIASYNIRNDNKGDSIAGNGWKQRCPVISNLILFHDFDVMGTQEGLHHQLEDMKGQLTGYSYIGVGRDDGKTKGEYSAIFYKKDKFKVLNNGDFWLSENTEKPNLGWDAACIRVCTWGEFQEVKTGFKFYFFNVHLDHKGVEARKNGSKLILDKIKAIAGKNAAILTGDFNVDQNNESYILLNTSGILKDAYELAQVRYGTNGTFNGFDPNAYTESRIDHLFLTKDFSVSRYGILTDSYRSKAATNQEATTKKDAPQEISFRKFDARLPSDHFPVVIEAVFTP